MRILQAVRARACGMIFFRALFISFRFQTSLCYWIVPTPKIHYWIWSPFPAERNPILTQAAEVKKYLFGEAAVTLQPDQRD